MNSSESTLPPSGLPLTNAIDALIETLDQCNVRYAVIGGVAMMQYARLRVTDDIDALIAPAQVATPGLFEALKLRGFALDHDKCVREFRDDGITLIRYGGVVVDLLRPVLPVYARVIDRAKTIVFRDRQVRVSAPEGLLLMKLIALRPQDEADVRDLLAAHGATLDLRAVRAELTTVIPTDDPRYASFDEWVRQAGFADRLT